MSCAAAGDATRALPGPSLSVESFQRAVRPYIDGRPIPTFTPGGRRRGHKESMAVAKLVYAFTEGNKDLKDLLGGKGANLAEMTNIGLPVPPGFTITTEACRYFLQH